MDAIFSFEGIERPEATIGTTWNEFRLALAKGEFNYNEIDRALQSQFLKVFNDLFQNCKGHFELSYETLRKSGNRFARGAILKLGETPNYERFMPKSQYIKEDNRFSPPGVEWLYLAFGVKDNAEKCTISECKARIGDRFAICEFILDKKYDGLKLIDLSIADGLRYDDINKKFLNRFKEYRDKAILLSKLNGKPTKPADFEQFGTETFDSWMVYTYVRMMTQELFIPVETSDKKLMYAPFQCLASYFHEQGFSGIIYSSTVFPEGKNIVLFDKDYAIPCGVINDFVINN